MAKLRLLKNRKEAGTTHGPAREGEHSTANLRGFGDPALFHQSCFVVHLLVKGQISDATLNRLVPAYNLHVERHPTQANAFQVRTHWVAPEQHKLQAIRLFAAAMDIHRAHPGISLRICQSNGLHELMQSRMPGRKHENVFTTHADFFQSEIHSFAMDQSVRMYLQQAGLPIGGTTSGMHECTHAELDQMHDFMMGQTHAPASKRKAG
ncbi:MAG: hypothetical protein AB7P04_06225 [Bacteriovoracia bacterium]